MAVVARKRSLIDCKFGDKQVKKILYMDNIVWEEWVMVDDQIAPLTTTSNDDWFSTSKAVLKEPIIPLKIYLYFDYDYHAVENSVSTSGGLFLYYLCADGTSNGSSNALTFGSGLTFGRPSSGKTEKMITLSQDEINWLKSHGGIVQLNYGAGGGSHHGTQGCGGYIDGYLKRGSD